MLSLTTRIFDQATIDYDGSQLTPHWIYRRFGIAGDAIVAFVGGADVSLDHMVDLEDVKKKAPIYSPRMLHFLGEFFIDSLDVGILLQHLFMDEIYGSLLEKGIAPMRRRGNDLYFQDRKLSVSIATRSTVSVLFHGAVNLETEGTPIPTSGLTEMGIEAVPFATEILQRFDANARTWRSARSKVTPR